MIVDPGATAQVDLGIDWEVGIVEEEVVTAVQRAAKIVDAPAAVTSIPAGGDRDCRPPHGQVPKLLEFTPGAEITQSGLYDFNFNTRGFNSSLNRRVSTYIDGRDVGVVLLGAQEWAAISGEPGRRRPSGFRPRTQRRALRGERVERCGEHHDQDPAGEPGRPFCA